MALFKGLVSFLSLVGTVIALTYMFAYFENYSRSSGFISTKRENQTTNTLEFESEKKIGDKRKTCEVYIFLFSYINIDFLILLFSQS